MKKEINAQHVAEYFLRLGKDADECISNLKIQKLCYYAQGLYLAATSNPLFEDKIEAWQHGPVCPELYHKYKIYGNNSIKYDDSVNLDDLFDPEQQEFLDEVYKVYAQFSAWRLREMTHEETPWLEAIKQGNGTVIKQKSLEKFFKDFIR